MCASMTCRIVMPAPPLGALLGHQDSDTTLQYVHLCDDAVLASAQVVGDAIASREVQNV